MTTIHQEDYEALKEQLAAWSRVSIVSAKVAEVLSDRLRTAHERYRTRLMRMATDSRVWKDRPASEQLAMLERIRTVLGAGEPRVPPAWSGATRVPR